MLRSERLIRAGFNRRFDPMAIAQSAEPYSRGTQRRYENGRLGSMLSKKGLRDGLNDDSC
jgi:hypothetical protein